MVFSSMVFLWVFLPVTVVGYYLMPDRCKNIFLLLASLIFYSWGEPLYVVLMVLSIVVNWALGLAIDRWTAYKKPLLALDVVFNLGLLGYYKYSGFAVSTLNAVLHTKLPVPQVALPIGISFFTFQILSYVIDLYRGKYPVQKSLIRLALYISFFPQLIAGPIVKYRDVNDQIERRHTTPEQFAGGVRRFLYGLGKKVIISNSVAAVVDALFGLADAQVTGALAWVAAVFYAVQLYYDFSGYSDMAIGMGKMFGFEFAENFRYPYLSASLTEFWARWHISLGTWFREYLYFPLGGSRKGPVRAYINLMIVFTVTGLWHGAGLNFILWGAYYGVFSLIERLGLGRVLARSRPLGHLYTLVVLHFSFVLFRAGGLRQAVAFITRMLAPWRYTATDVVWQQLIPPSAICAVVLGILGCGLIQTLAQRLPLLRRFRWQGSYAELAFCAGIYIVSVALLAGNSYNPFIYFRF